MQFIIAPAYLKPHRLLVVLKVAVITKHFFYNIIGKNILTNLTGTVDKLSFCIKLIK